MASAAPIGIVIPGYGHPRFLAEAIHSACQQDIDVPLKVVVVDDGCRFEETADTVAALMNEYPGILHYMRHPNAKLPGARNAGVRFLLKLCPDLDAVYFLDADNRIEPYSLAAYRAALGDDPSVGWAYPDITFFGQVWSAEGFDTRETAPRYSPLLHLLGNVAEAGSMVRVGAFKAGVWYDETMKNGFEDWEFWLSMLEAGYIGTRVRNAGFSYRRRPESMLANSRRLEETLIGYIRRKHAPLYAPRRLMTLEHEEAPAFALVSPDQATVQLFTDPLEPPRAVTLDAFAADMHRWYAAPKEHFFPSHILFASSEQWRQMSDKPLLLRWLFWRLREQETALTTIFFDTTERLFAERRPWGSPSKAEMALLATSAGLRDLLDQPAATASISDLPPAAKLMVETPLPVLKDTPRDNADNLYQALIALCSRAHAGGGRIRHMQRRYTGPSHAGFRETLIAASCASEEQQPYAVAHERARMVVALDQNMVTDVAAQARITPLFDAAHTQGIELGLVQEYQAHLDVGWLDEAAWADHIKDLFPLLQRGNQEEFRMYLGRRISARLPMSSKADVSTFARLADSILCIGAAGTLETLGEIRGFGVKTAVWLDDVFEGSVEGESVAKMLAYEHAIDHVVTDNRLLAARLSAQGVPPGKLLTLADFIDHGCLTAVDRPAASAPAEASQ